MPVLTATDRILARTLLPFVPRFVMPNQITVFRFLTIPFVGYLLYTESYLAGSILFALSSFSDAVDGSLARTRNLVSEWGKTFDPLADKLLIGTAGAIVVTRYLSVYLTLTIIVIEVFLVAGAYYRKRYLGVPIEAEVSGKVKMVLQSLGILSLIVFALFPMPPLLVAAEYLLYLSIVFAIISLIVYKSI